jgi:hypothetical protein
MPVDERLLHGGFALAQGGPQQLLWFRRCESSQTRAGHNEFGDAFCAQRKHLGELIGEKVASSPEPWISTNSPDSRGDKVEVDRDRFVLFVIQVEEREPVQNACADGGDELRIGDAFSSSLRNELLQRSRPPGSHR